MRSLTVLLLLVFFLLSGSGCMSRSSPSREGKVQQTPSPLGSASGAVNRALSGGIPAAEDSSLPLPIPSGASVQPSPSHTASVPPAANPAPSLPPSPPASSPSLPRILSSPEKSASAREAAAEEQKEIAKRELKEAAEKAKDKARAKAQELLDLQNKRKQLAAATRSRESAGKSQLSTKDLRQKYPNSFVFKGTNTVKRIALTFDDAPDTAYTPQVLDILKKYRVRATFFLVGYRAVEHPEMVKRIAQEGHTIGNHSYGHSLLRKLPQDKFVKEIEKAEQVLTPLIGYTPRLVRPPYGSVNDTELSWLTDNGYLTVNWNVDPEDWKGLPGDEVLRRSLAGAAPGSIILMHCATGTGGNLNGTVTALPLLIEKLRSQGYELVTIPELLHVRKAK